MASVKRRRRKGVNCSSTCYTRDHYSFGECMRAKSLNLSPHINDSYHARQGAWDKELGAYEGAVRQGVQPAGTTMAKVREAMEKSDATGVAYQAV